MLRAAVQHLRQADPVIARVITRVGPCRFSRREEGTHFGALARAIVYQQLSGKAAATILARLNALTDGRPATPSQMLSITDAQFRAAGVSNQKAGYLRNLAAQIDEGHLPVKRLGRLADDRVIEALTTVKGVGRWTAQMFLMFRLGRPDVLPEADLGIQKAIQVAYGLRSRPGPERVRAMGVSWAPYRTIASWYLWRSLD